MTQTKHTPTPWEFKAIPRTENADGSLTIPHCVVIAEGSEIYNGASHSCITNDEREANARLIAAAPELLEAVKMAAEVLNFQTDVDLGADVVHLKNVLDAVITKATA